MDPQKTSILLLDDEPDIRNEMHEFLASRGISVCEAATPSEAFKYLASDPIDIAIIDIRLPGMNGLEVLARIKETYPKIQVIMMSGHGDMDAVILALRRGAVDFFQKPFLLHEMFATIEKTRKFTTKSKPFNGDQFEYTLQEAFGKNPSDSFIVVSRAMKVVVDQMKKVSRSKDTTVLITGESGTGKELIARGLHYLSIRKDKPFRAVNCSTIPDELFESEFFGYEKGAFTGANTDKPGWFEVADGGTLFLDEIGDMKPGLQAKLLRVMENQQVSRLGSTHSRKIDVRIIAATNQDLKKLIQECRFRQDLYHRINTFVIDLPPLRERAEGIPLLVSHFLDYFCFKFERSIPQVQPEVMDALLMYDYPGNVRELKHMVERALILSDGDMLTFEHFDKLMYKLPANIKGSGDGGEKTLERIEKASIEAALREAQYNKSMAARILNISRQALDRKIEKLGIKF